MKLNYKTTFYVGLIFFSISMFWQAYDMLIARTLIDKFGLNQFESGLVMAFDNIMAVILLPLFGALSDRSQHRLGRRTPYIIVGTVIAALAFMTLSYADYKQTERIQTTNIIKEHYDVAFDENEDITLKTHWYMVIGHMQDERFETFVDGSISSKAYEAWKSDIYIPIQDILARSPETLSVSDQTRVRDLYYQYLSLRAWELTAEDPDIFYTFLAILFVSLVAMAIYRTPAIALMPDVVIKPLRTNANAFITFLGAIGGVVAIFIILFSGLNQHAYHHHASVYIVIGLIMFIALGLFLWKVKEPKLVKEKENLEKKYHTKELDPYENPEKSLNAKKRISLYLLLATVFLLFFGYNAVMSKITDYLPKVLNMEFYQLPFIIAQGIVIAAIYPIGLLSIKIGRKKSMLLGIFILVLAMGSIVFIEQNQIILTAIIITFAGFGWTFTGVNIYPMVVELSKGKNVGQYTGYYYAASMGAQIFTPILSGILMDRFGRIILFPYATIFIALAFVTMLLVRHGDSQKIDFMKFFKKKKV
jgi:maltose/moltooligosaccharide transporter